MALGALLAASGAEKKKSGTALGRLGAKKGAKMAKWNPANFELPHFGGFQVGVQNWTLILELSRWILELSKSILEALQEHFGMQK